MPIYEYKCIECDHRLEKLQKMSDDPLKDCPQCQKPALTKLVSAASFQLKGSGWYETDFKNNKKKTEASPVEQSKTSKGATEPAPKGKTDAAAKPAPAP